MPEPETLIPSSERDRVLIFFDDYVQEVVELLEENTLKASGRLKFAAFLTALAALTKDTAGKIDAWSRKNIPRVYRANVRAVDEILKSVGVRGRQFAATRGFKSVHDETIRLLVEEPALGVGPRLTVALRNMEANFSQYARHHRRLTKQLRFLREGIAEGLIEGRTQREVIEGILKSLTGERTEDWLALQRFEGVSKGGALRTLSEAPYVKVPLSAGGFRRIHIRDHVKTLVVTMESEVRTQARLNRMRQRKIHLAQVSPNPPLRPDLCAIFAGRVFSLDEATQAQTGYPLLSRTPGGGPPFHPNCFVPTTVIATDQGQRTINMIHVGDKVMTALGEWRSVTRVDRRPYKGDVFRFKTHSGRSFVSTPNHRVVATFGCKEGEALERLMEEATEHDRGGMTVKSIYEVSLNDTPIFISVIDIPRGRFKSDSVLPEIDLVKSVIPESYEGYVHNMEVEGHHSYTAGGIGVFNCTHTVLPFVPGITDNSLTSSSGVAVGNENGVPKAALDVPWEDAEKWLVKRGGFDYALRQNPQLRSQRPLPGSSKAIREALK